MGRFRFGMQNILNIKTSMETQAKNQYAAANAKLLQEEEKLEEDKPEEEEEEAV